WAFQMDWQSNARAVTSMASPWTWEGSVDSRRRYAERCAARRLASGLCIMREPGPLRGTPPRLCTTSTKTCCWWCGTLSRVAAGSLAILPLLLCACGVSLQQRSPTVRLPRAHHPLQVVGRTLRRHPRCGRSRVPRALQPYGLGQRLTVLDGLREVIAV